MLRPQVAEGAAFEQKAALSFIRLGKAMNPQDSSVEVLYPMQALDKEVAFGDRRIQRIRRRLSKSGECHFFDTLQEFPLLKTISCDKI